MGLGQSAQLFQSRTQPITAKRFGNYSRRRFRQPWPFPYATGPGLGSVGCPPILSGLGGPPRSCRLQSYPSVVTGRCWPWLLSGRRGQLLLWDAARLQARASPIARRGCDALRSASHDARKKSIIASLTLASRPTAGHLVAIQTEGRVLIRENQTNITPSQH
jgi:hypothetical protein